MLERWRQSGDTLAAFARQYGVTPHGCTTGRSGWARRPRSPSPPFALAPATVIAVEPTPVVAVRLPGGVALDVANATPRWVAALVAELARSAS